MLRLESDRDLPSQFEHLLIHIQAADFGKVLLELVENQDQIRPAENSLLNAAQTLLGGAPDEILHEFLRDAARLNQNQALGDVHLGQQIREESDRKGQRDEGYENPQSATNKNGQNVTEVVQTRSFHRANLQRSGVRNLREAKTRLSSKPKIAVPSYR